MKFSIELLFMFLCIIYVFWGSNNGTYITYNIILEM